MESITGCSAFSFLSQSLAMNANQYLSQGKFHRSIICKRTQQRVTFALVGNWAEHHHYYYPPKPSVAAASEDEKPLILFVLPSGCSRYVGIQLDGIVSAHGLRLLAIDRPGAGATPSCPLEDRMTISTKQTISVLESLGYGRNQSEDGSSSNNVIPPGKINILTHSIGWLYALDLITARPDFFDKTTCFASVSPFVPTQCSGNTTLSILPKTVVQWAPHAFSVLKFCGDAVTWSSGMACDMGVLSAESKAEDDDDSNLSDKKRAKRNRTRKTSQARLPTARFHPPYDSHLLLGLDAWKKTPSPQSRPINPTTGRSLKDGQSLLFEYLADEGGVKAATEDFLICLGKVDGMNSKQLQKWIEGKVKELASIFKLGNGEEQNNGRFTFLVVWGEKDFLIPTKGQDYLNTLLEKTDGLSMKKWIMAGGGHDDTLSSKQVMNDVFDFVAG